MAVMYLLICRHRLGALRSSYDDAQRLCSHMLADDCKDVTCLRNVQASSWCTEEGDVLIGLQNRYMELFGTMLSTCDEAQRLYSHMLGCKQQAEKTLSSKEKLLQSLQQQLLK